MNKFLTLLGRELRAYFYSPLAYVILFFFLLLNGFFFYSAVSILSREPSERTLVDAFFGSIPFWIGFLLIFPPLTMRLFAEEFKMGTIEPLMTAPVRDSQVVLAKFLGTFLFYCLLWAPTVLYFVIFHRITHGSDPLPMAAYWGSYLAIVLIGMFFLSIGCFASALTHNQMSAAMISFVLILLFFIGGLLTAILPNIVPLFRMLASYICVIEHMGEFSGGVIDSRRFVFYLSGTALMLFLTHQVFQRRRWRA